MTRFAALLLALLLAGCAARPAHPDAFAFGIVGDTPYNTEEAARFLTAIDEMNARPLAFVVHVGDMKAGGNSPCTDELFFERRRQFERSRHPFVFVPGDNDWVDCRRKSNGSMDPLERLERLRAIFYGSGATEPAAGTQRMLFYPENARWVRNGVVFVTLNVQGSNDNMGFDSASDRERERRLLGNLAWLTEAATLAAKPGARGLVVIFHADPFVAGGEKTYAPLLAALADTALGLGRPVLVIHGDTHWLTIDQPFHDASGRRVANLTRLETYGSPWVGWVNVTVDPGDPGLFFFEPRAIPAK